MQQGTCPTCRLHVLLPEEFPGHPSRHLPKIWSKGMITQRNFSYQIPELSFTFYYELIVWVVWSSVLFSIVQKKLAYLIKAAAKEDGTNLQDLELNWKGLNFKRYIIFALIIVRIYLRMFLSFSFLFHLSFIVPQNMLHFNFLKSI